MLHNDHDASGWDWLIRSEIERLQSELEDEGDRYMSNKRIMKPGRVRRDLKSIIINDEKAIVRHKAKMEKKGWVFDRFIPYTNGCTTHVQMHYVKPE